MKKLLALLLLTSVLLCGCERWTDGSYNHVSPHPITDDQGGTANITVSNYNELLSAMDDMVQSGMEHGIFSIAKYDPTRISAHMETAAQYTRETNPMGAYAVEDITWELGTSGGQNAVAVDITYRYDRLELRNIRKVDSMESAKQAIFKALDDCASGVVLYVQSYVETDFEQLVDDYSDESPQTVMEKPQVVSTVYPRTGINRVVELKFSYQNSREALRNMQSQVSPVFAAARLYVAGDSSDTEKLSQLYAFLMERYEYRFETSITPTYSLLRHGVGDNKAFAKVYAAMCRQAGMECMVVTGTRAGEPWYWNLVKDGEHYFHVDLLQCNAQNAFRECTDSQMSGYVWDFSAYPASEDLPPEEVTEPVETTTPPSTEIPQENP